MPEERQNPFENGATWVRADFHLHTKADREFSYAGEENSFVRDYINALKEQNIQVAVITNHNKFDVGEFKALRKEAEKEQILILPGVELSVEDGANGIHALLVFSDDWITENHDYINKCLVTSYTI